MRLLLWMNVVLDFICMGFANDIYLEMLGA